MAEVCRGFEKFTLVVRLIVELPEVGPATGNNC